MIYKKFLMFILVLGIGLYLSTASNYVAEGESNSPQTKSAEARQPAAPASAEQPSGGFKEEKPVAKEELSTEEIAPKPQPVPKPKLELFGLDFFKQAPSSFAPIPETPVPPTYSLGPGDVLNIRFWTKTIEETTYRPTVSPEGAIVIPLVGAINVRGLTLDQFRALLLEELSKYYKGVKLVITLEEIRTLRVFVTGEAARPGGYALSALSTAFNALYMAGGPNERGSMRRIQLIRNNHTIGTIDLYQYLLTGDKSQDYELESGDTIFIPVIGPVVAIGGEVKRPALYELKGNERLKDLVETAGGIWGSTYLERAQIDRVEANKERRVLDVDISDIFSNPDGSENMHLRDGDAIKVFKVLDLKMNVVYIEGQVQRPGEYELKPGMRVKDLVDEAEGLKEEVYFDRTDLTRTLPDMRIQVIPFNLAKALDGDDGQNYRLERWDRIRVYSADEVLLPRVVYIKGRVKRPGTYKRLVDMKVSDLLFAAGGLLHDAYLEKAILVRIREDETKETIPINLYRVERGDSAHDLVLRNRDSLTIYSLEEADIIWRLKRVTIKGQVQRPSSYELTENMRVKDLVFEAGGYLPDAYLERADLVRVRPDETKEIIRVNLRLVEGDDTIHNILLQERDELTVYSLGEVEWKDRTVWISGAVQRPGEFERKENMKLKDLIFEAGGLLPEASDVCEISRARGEKGTQIINVDLKKLLEQDDETQNIMLEDRDQVSIKVVSGYLREAETVSIQGEVKFPGKYALKSRNEKLSALIEKAGGLTEDAFPEGAIFLRRTDKLVGSEQKKIAEDVRTNVQAAVQRLYQVELSRYGISPTLSEGALSISQSTGLAGAATAEAAMGAAAVAAEQPVVVVPPRELPAIAPAGKVAVDLKRILESKGAKGDVVLEDGDTIIVPKKPLTVSISGAVSNPTAIIYEPNRKIDYYAEKAGGYTEDADRGRAVVIRANGEVLPASKVAVVQQGDIIFVPTKPWIERPKTRWEKLQQIGRLLASAAIMLYTVHVLNK